MTDVSTCFQKITIKNKIFYYKFDKWPLFIFCGYFVVSNVSGANDVLRMTDVI